MKKLILCFAFLLIQCQSTSFHRQMASAKLILDSSGYLYDPLDKSCDGYPRVSVQTTPGTCLGLVFPRDLAMDPETKMGFVKPRTIVQIPQTRNFLVVDMGGWAPNNGRLFLLSPANSGRYELKLLKFPLDNPHGLALGPDGYFYLGEKTQISRFHLKNFKVVDWQLVIGNLVRKEGYMHPLSQFIFDPRNGDLFINAGSPSDHCFASGNGAYRSCPESEDQGAGVIFRIANEKLKNLPKEGIPFFEIVAKGLRNSMAMAIHPSGFLIQGENSRDFPELEEPYEEINVIDLNGGAGRHYGWPYCYNFYATSPEFLAKDFKSFVDCTNPEAKSVGEYQAPHALMPPHVAPLHMAYYKGRMFSDLFAGQLLVTWHGYQPTGHRLVAYNVDDQGRPRLQIPDSNSQYHVDQSKACPLDKKFDPRGGMPQYAPYTEIISAWNSVKNLRPKGAPVSFTEAEDGSLWIIEDRENRDILRLARSPSANYQDHCEQTSAGTADPLISLLAWRHRIRANPTLDFGYKQIQSELIEKNCLGCHGNLQSNEIAEDRFSNLDFLMTNDWLAPGSLQKSKIYGAIAHLEGYTPMPPADKPQFFGTPEGKRLNDMLEQWILALPKEEIESTYTSWKLNDKRNIRQKPSTVSAICGQLQKGDLTYGDLRSQSVVRTEAIQWAKVFLLPTHSRLIKGACAFPEDGVFWIAL